MVTHHDSAVEYAKFERVKKSTRQEISKNMRNFSYFAIRTTQPFSQLPPFLATLNRCGPQLGNINHSKLYVTKYALPLDEIFKGRTEDWIMSENDLTITLNIGNKYYQWFRCAFDEISASNIQEGFVPCRCLY